MLHDGRKLGGERRSHATRAPEARASLEASRKSPGSRASTPSRAPSNPRRSGSRLGKAAPGSKLAAPGAPSARVASPPGRRRCALRALVRATPVFGDPKTDFVFQRIFGSDDHKTALLGFLNDILQLDGAHRITAVALLPPEQRPKVSELKNSIVDVKCVDARGTTYVVEMQVFNVEAFEKRVVYNVAKAYTNQLGTGFAYPELDDVVGISICDFELWPYADKARQVPMLSRWRMQEQHSGVTASATPPVRVPGAAEVRGRARPADARGQVGLLLPRGREPDGHPRAPPVSAALLDALEGARDGKFQPARVGMRTSRRAWPSRTSGERCRSRASGG